MGANLSISISLGFKVANGNLKNHIQLDNKIRKQHNMTSE